jgi:ABC-2 type transport system permease protein
VLRSSWFLPQVFMIEIRKVLAYRTDFWIQFLGVLLVQFTVAYYLWKSVFDTQGVHEVGAYSFRTLMLYYLLVPLIGRAVRGSDTGDIVQDIYDGSLTRYLVYPVSFLAFRLTRDFAHTVIFLAQCLVAVLVYEAIFSSGGLAVVTLTNVGMTLGAVLVGTALHFVMISFVELTAFWADNVWSLVVIERFITGLLGGAMLPLALFPESLQRVLAWLPFGYLVSFPVRCCMGQMGIHEWSVGMAICGAWIVFFLAGFRFLWRRGLLQYTGVGI